jgi:hypothetical protein
MQRPLRTVPAKGVPADAASTALLTTRTQLALVVAPSDVVGPEGHWVPATGHNLTLTVSEPLSSPVTVSSIGVLVEARTAFPGSVGLSMATSQMPQLGFSPDLLESLQRSKAAYRPLDVPDAAIFLDAEPPDIGMLRPLDPPPLSPSCSLRSPGHAVGCAGACIARSSVAAAPTLSIGTCP